MFCISSPSSGGGFGTALPPECLEKFTLFWRFCLSSSGVYWGSDGYRFLETNDIFCSPNRTSGPFCGSHSSCLRIWLASFCSSYFFLPWAFLYPYFSSLLSLTPRLGSLDCPVQARGKVNILDLQEKTGTSYSQCLN